MRIEQALYGEDRDRGGHSLLEASGDDEVSNEVFHRLDLPDTAPIDVEWSPFLRGFPHRDRYFLSRTFLDTRASRGGMVFSHALIVSLDDMVRISDLRPLVKLLAADERSRPFMEAVDLASVGTQPPESHDLMNAAEALASMKKLPAVRVGHVGFDDLVVALWARLLPTMRRNFAFRLSFSPNDLVEDTTPALVCTPHAVVGCWAGYRVIGSGISQEPTSPGSAMLSGRGNDALFLEFMREIGAEPETFRDFQLLDQAYKFSMKQRTLRSCIGAVRLIEKLSPDSKVGRDRKDIHLQRLMEVIIGADVEEILLMRNLQFSAFPSPNRVWEKLETWAMESIYPHDQDRHMLLALKDATSDSAVVGWRAALLDGLMAAARACKPAFVDAFWRWIQVCPDIVDSAFCDVMTEKDVEACIAEAAPHNIDEEIAETLLVLARSRGWLRMHGVVLSTTCRPLDSVRQQIAVDTDQSFIEGVRFSLRNAKQKEILNCALEIGDPRAIALAGEAVARQPDLLRSVDFSELNAQAIWQKALVINPESWRGLVNPKAAIYIVLDRLLDGEKVKSSLVDQLSLSPIADLGGYPHRAKVWRHVDGFARDNFLATTVKGWLERAADSHVPFKPEPELQSAILVADALEPTLNRLCPDHFGTAVRIISALDQYDENRFVSLIRHVIANLFSLSASDAEGIGRLILNRRWVEAAHYVVREYQSGRGDLKPTLRTCYHILGFWTRLSLGLTPLSESEKWDALADLATELYPGGPNEKGVWERAGGNDSDLLLHEDGRMQWRKALRNVRKGAGVRPTNLLDRMKEDFPNNKQIFDLSNDSIFKEEI